MDDDQLALTPQRIHSDLQQLAFIIIPRTEGPETRAPSNSDMPIYISKSKQPFRINRKA